MTYLFLVGRAILKQESNKSGRQNNYLPAFLRVFFSLVVEIQADLRINAHTKIIVHHTFLLVVVSTTEKQRVFKLLET